MITKPAAAAAHICQSLQGKKITPHTKRHTAAMNLLHADVAVQQDFGRLVLAELFFCMAGDLAAGAEAQDEAARFLKTHLFLSTGSAS